MKEVICVSASGFEGVLTPEKVYQVIEEGPYAYMVRDDRGINAAYRKTKFIDKGNDLKESPLKDIAKEIGELVQEKNEAYGNSFGKSGDFLKLLYPDGIKPEQYQDMLLVVRIFDKQMRIANKKDAFGESPYRDIAGYGILGAWEGDGEMSKERLEKAKELGESYETEYLSNHPMFLDEDIETLKWMFEQAERVQELEEQNKRYREAIEKAISDLENECLWDALVKLKALEREEG